MENIFIRKLKIILISRWKRHNNAPVGRRNLELEAWSLELTWRKNKFYPESKKIPQKVAKSF
jgi:hypothetical protein